jgi:hypothetical protein
MPLGSYGLSPLKTADTISVRPVFTGFPSHKGLRAIVFYRSAFMGLHQIMLSWEFSRGESINWLVQLERNLL